MYIQRINISGYRSLWDVTIGNLGPVNIFYGDNNTGKSNILAALETLFRIEAVEEMETAVGRFLQGTLPNFVDNFTMKPGGERVEAIRFQVRLGLDDRDLQNLAAFSEFIERHNIFESGHNQRVQLDTEITPLTRNQAMKTVMRASINNKLFYDRSLPETNRFFPALMKQAAIEDRQGPAEELFQYLVNSFVRVSAGRFLQSETSVETPVMNLSSQWFKNWLRFLSGSRGESYRTFERIQEWFRGKPFGYGTIRSISEGDRIELVVTDESGRELLVERLGTGVQQVLMLLSNIANSDAKIVGFEELELNLSPRMQSETLNKLKELAGPPSGSVDQFLLTSHSMHLSRREDAVLYAVSLTEAHGTKVQRGPLAIRQLPEHFAYGLFRLPRSRRWRT